MITATLPKAQIQKIATRLRANAEKMRKIGDAAREQIMQRFRSGGASGDKPWPQGKFPALAKKPPLAGMEESFVTTAEEKVAKVESSGRFAAFHQQGCVTAGGVLPDIVPVRARALYVPISPAGVRAHEVFKARAPKITHVYAGSASIEKPKFDKSSYVGAPLAVYGVDFLLLQRVSIPPRPMLPTSTHELADLAKQAIEILKG
jgi:phage gpG-like protein